MARETDVYQLLLGQFAKGQSSRTLGSAKRNLRKQLRKETPCNGRRLAAIPKDPLALVPVRINCIYCLIVLVHLEHIVPTVQKLSAFAFLNRDTIDMNTDTMHILSP
jgi:hypothetical protein